MKRLSFLMILVVVSFFACGTSKKDAQSEASMGAPHRGNALLSSAEWVTTRVYDAVGNDLTANYQQFVGLAHYGTDQTYEFFDLDGNPRGDQGYFFVLPDMTKRILVSLTRNYTRIVDITELTPDVFTYRVTVDNQEVFVEHIPVGAAPLEPIEELEELSTLEGSENLDLIEENQPEAPLMAE